jgi:hypothetical protein
MSTLQLDLDKLAKDYDETFWRYYLWAIRFFFQFQYLIQKPALDRAKANSDPNVTFDVSPLNSVLDMKKLREMLDKIEVLLLCSISLTSLIPLRNIAH